MRETDPQRSGRPTFRELEALHALVEYRKTTSAAQKLGVSQPAISRAIHDLEERIGTKLFRREGGRLHATTEGVRFYEETRAIFAALDRLGRENTAERESSLRVIAPPTLAHTFLPPLLAGYVRQSPGVRLQIEVGTTSDVVSKVADGNFDVGVADSHGAHPSLIYEPFRRTYAHIAMRTENPLAAKSEIVPSDINGLPFVALTRRFPSRGALERIMGDAGMELSITVEVATSALAFELVRAGAGIALVNPFPVASMHRNDGVVLRPFAPRVSYECVFLRPAAQPPTAATRRFMDYVRERQQPDAYSDLVKADE
ncbi:MAG: LysR family transcriptional regulator [Beijerinckiaceae bacterium]